MRAAGTERSGRPGARPGRRTFDERGDQLVELLVASSIVAIVMAMTTVMLVVIQQQTNLTVASGQTTERATLALNDIASYVRGAITPAAAAAAAGVAEVDGQPSITACWGTTQPISAAYPAGDANTTYGIIVAHDYDLEFCGYPPGSSTPQVYEIYMGSCVNATYGYCTVSIVTYGTSYLDTSDFQNPTGAQSGASTVETIKNVWCDAACQAQLNPAANGGSNGVSCATYNLASVSPPSGVTCTGVGSPASSSLPNVSTYTPPLFTYFQTGAPTTPIVNLIDSDNQMDMSASAYATNLQSLGSIEIQLTLLSSTNTTTAAPEGQPGTSVEIQLDLPNISSGVTG